MSKKKNLLFFERAFFFILLLATAYPFAVAAEEIMVTGVLYDPEGADSGYEWIELYNPVNDSISLEDYHIEMGNGANQNDWTIIWEGGTGQSISSNGYFLIGEKDVVPVPDDISSLGIQNGPDGIRLKNNGTIIGTIGWGDHIYPEYYEGSPAVLASSGSALIRVNNNSEGTVLYQDTGNNSADFYEEQNPLPHTAASSGTLAVSVEVMLDTLEIISISMPDDDLDIGGYQISPYPGSSREVLFSAIVNSSEGCGSLDTAAFLLKNISYELEKSSVNSTLCMLSGSFSMDFQEEPKEYNISLNITSVNGGNNSTIISFDYLPMSAFELDSASLDFSALYPGSSSLISGDSDFSTKSRPTLRNIGNSVLDVGLMGTQLDSAGSSLDLSSLEYCFNCDDFNSPLGGRFNITMKTVDLNLAAGESAGVSFRMSIPDDAPGGRYSGSVALLAMPS